MNQTELFTSDSFVPASLYPSIHLLFYTFIHLSIHPYFPAFIRLQSVLSILPSVCPFIHPFIHPFRSSFQLSILLFMWLVSSLPFIHPSSLPFTQPSNHPPSVLPFIFSPSIHSTIRSSIGLRKLKSCKL